MATIVRRPKQLPDTLIREALPLDDVPGLRVADLAWNQAGAVQAVDSLFESSVVILGGHILARSDLGKLDFTGDNWHYNRESSLLPSENARISHARALEYINRYPDPLDGSILYILTFLDDS